MMTTNLRQELSRKEEEPSKDVQSCCNLVSNPCARRSFGTESVVCVCNDTYCDTYKKVVPIKKGSFVKYVSSRAGLRLKRSVEHFGPISSNFLAYDILISPAIAHQRILGFGTHFTDASGVWLNSLPAGAQRHLLMSYWSDQGSEYTLARVPMGGTDFSGHYYTYMDEFEEGTQLNGFNLTNEDYLLKIPHILTAKNISSHPIRFLTTPWTAPKWMKTSNRFSGGELKQEYYQAFADYYIKFLDAYRSHGIEFWAATMGNEPINGYFYMLSLPSMSWNPLSAAKWLKENLGPTIRSSKYYKDIKIIIFDDNRVLLPSLQIFCMDVEAMKYVNGISLHWYWDIVTPEQTLLLANCPNRNDLFLLMDEATKGLMEKMPVHLGNWERAESYINSIFSYLKYGFSGWMDWNLALDVDGGPNLTGYCVDSSIIVNATAREFYKQPTFYAIAHFSKFIPPDSVRIESQIDGKLFGWFNKVTQMAFKRPDGGIVVVLYNNDNNYIDVDVKDEKRGQIKLQLRPKSITTILYW